MSPNSSQKSSAEVCAEIEEVLKRQEEEEKERKKRQEELARQLVELHAAEEAEKAAEEAGAQRKRAEGKKKVEVKKGGVRGGSEASGSKWKAPSVEVVMPPRKKTKQEAEMTEGQFWDSVAATLGRVVVVSGEPQLIWTRSG